MSLKKINTIIYFYYIYYMKLLFVNPSLRPGSDHLFLPVGLGYVMTYALELCYSRGNSKVI